ncbi:hypothetical protein Taro_043481, partial [Colocasia esculenta]|nr:hypothetical protein [Colocasia esculenta]
LASEHLADPTRGGELHLLMEGRRHRLDSSDQTSTKDDNVAGHVPDDQEIHHLGHARRSRPEGGREANSTHRLNRHPREAEQRRLYRGELVGFKAHKEITIVSQYVGGTSIVYQNPTHITMIDGCRNDQRISVWGSNPYKVFVQEGYGFLGPCIGGIRGIRDWPGHRRPVHDVYSPCIIASALSTLSTCAESSHDHIDFLPVGLIVDRLLGSPLSASGAVVIPAHELSEAATLNEGLDFVLELAAFGGVVAMVTVEATILLLVAPSGVGAHPGWPPNIWLIPDFCQDLFGCHPARLSSHAAWRCAVERSSARVKGCCTPSVLCRKPSQVPWIRTLVANGTSSEKRGRGARLRPSAEEVVPKGLLQLVEGRDGTCMEGFEPGPSSFLQGGREGPAFGHIRCSMEHHMRLKPMDVIRRAEVLKERDGTSLINAAKGAPVSILSGGRYNHHEGVKGCLDSPGRKGERRPETCPRELDGARTLRSLPGVLGTVFEEMRRPAEGPRLPGEPRRGPDGP